MKRIFNKSKVITKIKGDNNEVIINVNINEDDE